MPKFKPEDRVRCIDNIYYGRRPDWGTIDIGKIYTIKDPSSSGNVSMNWVQLSDKNHGFHYPESWFILVNVNSVKAYMNNEITAFDFSEIIRKAIENNEENTIFGLGNE